jgi:hypothetical protein
MLNNIINKNNLLKIFILYYSLFQKKLFDSEKDIIQYFPENVFGIFSTIRRYNTIDTFPYDIHGCIGYWDNNFDLLPKNVLYEKLLQVSYNSLWYDNRKNYFDNIEYDPFSFQELDFMLKPIYNIDKNTGIIVELNKTFSNKLFGIIIQSKSLYNRATYLPEVFPDKMPWTELLLSIKNKANIIDENYDIFAYKIHQIKSQFIDIIRTQIFSFINIYNFSTFLFNNMKIELEFPFVYSYQNNKYEWNTTNDVRNISTIAELYKYISVLPKIKSIYEKILQDKILNILNNLDKYSSQSLSFLGYFYSINKNKNKLNNKDLYCKKLMTDLPFAEEDFEKPEIIIGLNNAECKLNYTKYLFEFNEKDSIFRMNWIIQTIISFNKKPSTILIDILINKINEIFNKKNYVETNFLAVAFEALCFVYKTENNEKVIYKIFQLFYELEKRKNKNNILYNFQNNSARIDITGHINNGLLKLNFTE